MAFHELREALRNGMGCVDRVGSDCRRRLHHARHLVQPRWHAPAGERTDPAFALAATGLVLWIIYVATDSEALAWISFVLLLVVAALGFTMVAIWQQQRRATATVTQAAAASSGPAQPAEQRFPLAVVVLHGIGAVTTLALVLLSALEV